MAQRPTILPVRVSLLEIIIICLISLCVLLLVSNNVESFIRVLYSPVAFLVLIVVIGEYIILKSADRSRIYKIELDQLRHLQMARIKMFHRLEQQLDEILASLDSIQKNAVDNDSKAQLEQLENNLRKIKEQLQPFL